MAIANDNSRAVEDIWEEIGVSMGERGDFIAVKSAEIGDDVLEGEFPDHRDVEELRAALDELAKMLAQLEEIEQTDELEEKIS